LSSLLVDTSFLITLASPQRLHHATAQQYFIESVRRGMQLYLSAIVISEFQVKQAVTDLPLRNFTVLPFNIDHAMMSGLLMRDLERDAGDDRVAVKDDLKLIAQSVCESITHVLTEDRNTLAKYIDRMRLAGKCSIYPLILADGFDEAWLNGGQLPLIAQ
jgi:predicted nucleic acid-binding protein